jgi:UDP-N-acetylmuramate: L-alanyl-gamma-D-glutamyl-meso-diaminopimelate ligase
MGAKLICNQLEVTDVEFYKAISSFQGASKRLQVVHSTENLSVFTDFAHAPSKVKATVDALKTHYPERKLVVCLELHTYSSLNKDFIGEYHNSLSGVDEAVIFYNPETVKNKNLENMSAKDIQKAFGRVNLEIITDTSELEAWIKKSCYKDSNLLFMSSGNFGGLDVHSLAKNLVVSC